MRRAQLFIAASDDTRQLYDGADGMGHDPGVQGFAFRCVPRSTRAALAFATGIE
jgi:hypothetical protein